MTEEHLHSLIDQVRQGTLPRRDFLHRMVALGLSGPMAAQLLMHAGVANAQPAFNYKPTKRGGGGQLKILMWQAPTLLNTHFATGAKDIEGARMFYEPLAHWDAEGNLVPVLAAEIPSLENGSVAKDGKSVVWKLKKGVTWHDGKPFTADDCIFNWEFAKDPAAAAVTSGSFKAVESIRKLDAHTIRIQFSKPTPFWADAFVTGGLIPKHLFQNYMGAKSREAPNNIKPVGTGAYKFVDFKPGDLLTGALNPNYHANNKPYFDSFEIKGGGDPTSAARAVLQTGEYDFAWGLVVEDEVLKRLEDAGKGRAHIAFAGDVEFMFLNFTDPWTEVEGERSHIRTKHFAFADPVVREAMTLLVDRGSIQQYIYGRTGQATSNYVNGPARYKSNNTKWEFNVEKANQMLDGAGWKRGSDGIREKGGKKMKFLLTTSTNSVRQKEQTVIKAACQKAGIEVELKAVAASMFFSSDVANLDTNTKFYADMEIFAIQWTSTDPQRALDRYVSWEVASKANKWQGRNISRWTSDDFDKLYRAADQELDPVKRAAMLIRMNDMAVNAQAVVPLIRRARVEAMVNKLQANLSPWDLAFSSIEDWYKDA